LHFYLAVKNKSYGERNRPMYAARASQGRLHFHAVA